MKFLYQVSRGRGHTFSEPTCKDSSPNKAFSPNIVPQTLSMMHSWFTQIETVPKRTMYSASGSSPWQVICTPRTNERFVLACAITHANHRHKTCDHRQAQNECARRDLYSLCLVFGGQPRADLVLRQRFHLRKKRALLYYIAEQLEAHLVCKSLWQIA
jgi:hypothetical protein